MGLTYVNNSENENYHFLIDYSKTELSSAIFRSSFFGENCYSNFLKAFTSVMSYYKKEYTVIRDRD